MSEHTTNPEEIPDARLYVTAQDTFMSGWGEADGKINVVVLPCMSDKEAQIVAENATCRKDMRSVAVLHDKPSDTVIDGKPVLYSVFDRHSSERWYTVGGFRCSR